MNNKIKIYIFGRHAKRIPFSYPAYQAFFAPFFEFTDQPRQADFLVCGLFVDIRENSEILAPLVKNNARLIVFSEEPLWDTLWYKNWQQLSQQVVVKLDKGTESWPFVFVNHATSALYNFQKIPYFLTTEDHYLFRYAQLLRIGLERTPRQLITDWYHAEKKYRFIAERRLDAKYHKVNDDGSLLALSVYRTELALKFSRFLHTECLGKGWHSDAPRQVLPDWHLDKLISLQQDRFIVSALENTTLPNYLTEKLFDVLSVGAVPIYWAGKGHRALEFVPKELLLNIANLDVKSASELIVAFKPDLAYAELYLDTQAQLLGRFAAIDNLIEERRVFSAKTYLCFSNLLTED